MEPIDYSLVSLGGGICLIVLIGLLAARRTLRLRSLPVRLGVWLTAGAVCFGGSQMLGKGLIGWWPFLGSPEFLVRLVQVKFSPSSRRIALTAFAGFKGKGVQSAAKLFVSDWDGENIVEVCEGRIMDIHWSADGEQLYLLRRQAGRQQPPSKSLWRYTPATRTLSYVRKLPRPTTVFSLDPEEESLLFTGPRAAQEAGRFLLVRGELDNDQEDRVVCWRKEWQTAHAWGPKTGNLFVATSDISSFGQGYGLWVMEADQANPLPPTFLLELSGIEGINLNVAETSAALFVRRWPPPCMDFDLYFLDLVDRRVQPITPYVEWDSAIWDRNGKKLAFADSDGLKTFTPSSGRIRLLVESPQSRMNPDRRDRLKPLGYSRSGEIVFQRGLWRVETYNLRTGAARRLFHAGQLRRYFKAAQARDPSRQPT
jgi:hypothetical protein